ncbi:unnamed protein product [Calypogeia fissa]
MACLGCPIGCDGDSQLRRHIIFDEEILQLLTQETVELCNRMLPGLGVDDPALLVQITDFRAVHLALALPTVPPGMQQGPTPEASFVAFRDWLIAATHQEPGVGTDQQVGGPLSTCWHQLSVHQSDGIVLQRWLYQRWSVAIQDAGLGPICLPLKMVGSGPGMAKVAVLPYIFG